ncbi:hypothetical protein CHELA40_10666 [Chelatococcus asaccharovorans]|nr:hypothetical protein CHELA40_10666 [Chelatococcus asaccharovorans]CAH1686309.1 hypothetical protein CHELA17_64942 [Chelatococcus asaccharovorans]
MFAGEYIHGISGGDVLATIHRLLRGEHEAGGARVGNLGFDGEWHARIPSAIIASEAEKVRPVEPHAEALGTPPTNGPPGPT